MAEFIRGKKVSPVELVTAHLARIEALNAKINAFVHVDAECALDSARTAELALMRNESLGPLHGVPISIKGSISVTGMPYEAGTKVRAGASCWMKSSSPRRKLKVCRPMGGPASNS